MTALNDLGGAARATAAALRVLAVEAELLSGALRSGAVLRIETAPGLDDTYRWRCVALGRVIGEGDGAPTQARAVTRAANWITSLPLDTDDLEAGWQAA